MALEVVSSDDCNDVGRRTVIFSMDFEYKFA